MANELHYAVIVGINRYPGIKDLTNCVSDAEAFRDWLLDSNGGDLIPENVQTVFLNENDVEEPLTRLDAKPDKDTIFEAIHVAIQKGEAVAETTPLDWEKTRFYFYVSGHGFSPTPRESALLMANSGPDWYGNNIGTSTLSDFLEERQCFKEVIILADCCRERVIGAPVGNVPWTVIPANRGGVRAFGGLAASFGEFAFENDDPNELRSYFTKAVLEGLSGKGLKAGETDITAPNLRRYIEKRLRTLTNHKNTPQEADIRIQRGDDFILAKVPPVQPVGVSISLTFPAGFNETIQLQNSSFALMENYPPYDTSQGTWELTLPIGMYKIVKSSDNSDLGLKVSGMFSVGSEGGHHEFLL